MRSVVLYVQYKGILNKHLHNLLHNLQYLHYYMVLRAASAQLLLFTVFGSAVLAN